MRIDELLHNVLSRRSAKLADAGVTVVEEAYREDISVGITSEQLGNVLGAVIDKAVRGMGAGVERRLVVKARRASRGVVVEIEYRRGTVAEPKSLARHERAEEEEDTREIVKYRESVSDWGGQVFISSAQRGATRYVIEVPAEASSAA